MSFEDRREAGRRLARELGRLGLDDPLVLGLPRGGIPVAFEVADRLDAPLDVVLVRKVSPPGRPEFGVGAVGEEDVLLLDRGSLDRLGLEPADLDETVENERVEMQRRAERYRGAAPPVPVRDRTCVVVDDGLATGVSATAAVQVLRRRGASRVVFAIPVGPPESVGQLREEADEVVCLLEPPSFTAVGTWYHDFSQTTDDEVVELLGQASRSALTQRDEQIPAAGVSLPATVVVPDDAVGVVVFAHGSGSSKDSPRNRAVARRLQAAGLATVLFDLLTPREAQVRDNVFDVGLLAQRLGAVVDWVTRDPATAGLPVGLFGASTGAAAALAAARGTAAVGAIVSRGGRVDFASEHLGEVRQPTLLVVGEQDEDVLALNREAADQLSAPHDLAIVEGADHLFEEPGAMDEVADAAREWFLRHLA